MKLKLTGLGLLFSLFVSTMALAESPITWLSAEKFTVYENQKCFDKTIQGKTEKSCAQVSAKLLKTNLPWLNEFLENKAVETGKTDILENARHLISESDPPQKIFDLMLNSDYQFIKTLSPADEVAEWEYQYEQHYLGQRHNLLMFLEVVAIPIGRSADGVFEENYINIDLATQKQLMLKDILIPGQE
ncbi:MAG TPA: hypothetical protein DD638_03365, partial [Pasteurellaceae bacterium]|nr:hypothetical protein [Pasteurellaceae bacterium]